MYYEYHIQYQTSTGWEGDPISGNCRKRNDNKWLKHLKKAGTRMVLYIKDEGKELEDIITLKTLRGNITDEVIRDWAEQKEPYLLDTELTDNEFLHYKMGLVDGAIAMRDDKVQ